MLEACLPIDNDLIKLFNGNEYELGIKDNIIKRTIIQFFGYIILIFASLILNEIIILNFFGFNKNTFSNISFRGTEDTIKLNDINEEKSLEDIENESDN